MSCVRGVTTLTSSATSSVNASRAPVRSLTKRRNKNGPIMELYRTPLPIGTVSESSPLTCTSIHRMTAPPRPKDFIFTKKNLCLAESRPWQNQGKLHLLCGFRPTCASSLPRRPADWRDRTDGVGNHTDEVKLSVLRQERREGSFQDPFNDFTYKWCETHGVVVGNVLWFILFVYLYRYHGRCYGIGE